MTNPNQMKFKFIDLFAGIGGFHLAMHRLGGECVFASEIDQYARQTYLYNFQKITPALFDKQNFNDDIRKISPYDIPDFDILCAGFPCQPFSQAGQKRGFEDTHHSERGNLFFNIVDIIEAKRPKAFFLENVRGLVAHDDGKTFSTIRHILEVELGYSFYYKIIHASDYGLPQLRPRVFIVGFRNEEGLKGFSFPLPTPLKFTMSDVWGGKCSRTIGFTLRVGGKGSKIDDRRNWDAYEVDGIVRQLTYREAQKMQGFPDNFVFPVSPTQAIKQLGNSVAVDAVEAVAKNVIAYMNTLEKEKTAMNTETKNKGEWSELLVFITLLLKQKLFLSDSKLNATTNYFDIKRVTTENLDLDFLISSASNIDIHHKHDKQLIKKIDMTTLINQDILNTLITSIQGNNGTFNIPAFNVIQTALGFSVVKGGNSNQKADILLDIENNNCFMAKQGFGIKSYLGSNPTLLNASGNTNFIFRIENLDSNLLSSLNAIDTPAKIKDRIASIETNGGIFHYEKPETETLDYNLKMVDSNMPQIIGHILLTFYKHRINKINDIIDFIHTEGILQNEIHYPDKFFLISKVKNLLVAILLGFFAGTKWNNEYAAQGTIVMKAAGDCVAFHIIDLASLKEYLFTHIKLDTPSSTRHRFGQLIEERNGQLYFKLNLQLRF